jgi:exodeoxyribonuclease V beta subunit
MSAFTELDLLGSPIEPGLTVIEASAGTGKTYSISHLVPRLLLEGTLPDLSKLLLVTFTKDAARELADRVRRVLTDLAGPPSPDAGERSQHIAALRPLTKDLAARARLERALGDLDLLAVSTIHAFCQRTLQQEGSLCGIPVMPEITTDDNEHLVPIVRELWLANLAADPTMAALATAQGWSLEAAIRFINSLRRCHHPLLEPAAPPYADVRARLGELCGRLATIHLVDSSKALILQVDKWNRGVDDTEDALARLEPLYEGDPKALTFWQSVQFAQDLPNKVRALSNAAKALKAQLNDHEWFVAIRDLAALVKQLEWTWQHQLASDAVPKLTHVLESRRLITQDGLIGAMYRALHRTTAEGAEQSTRLANHLAERYHVALIDESQDTDPRQFAIFKRVFLESATPRRLILVGDPKQAIYGFRGADLSTYLEARANAERGYTLTHTYRAPQPLVETINVLFQRDRAFHHPNMMFQPARSALEYDRLLWRKGQPCSRLEAWIVPADESRDYSSQGRRMSALSARIATTIVDLLHHGELRTTFRDGSTEERSRVSARDFAVLVATNAQAEAMAVALQERAVPVVVNSGADVFASDEAQDLHLLLKAILDPRRTRRLRAALATRLLGLDSAALTQIDMPSAQGEQDSLVWLERFTRWNQTWSTRGLAALLAELERPEIAITHRLAVIPLTGERRATNYRHLTDLLLEVARDEAPRPPETTRWLGQQIVRAADRSQAEERQLQLSSDREAVQVVTMHKAKGLEYPLVFCPYLADTLKKAEGIGQLPVVRAADDAKNSDVLVNLELLAEEAKASRARELMAAQLEERLRLAYVALTRAKVRVWICSYGSSPLYDQGSALDWLLRSDHELGDFREYSTDWLKAAKVGRAARHESVLQSLGAASQVDDSTASNTAPRITFRSPPSVSNERLSIDGGSGDLSAKLVALPPPVIPPSWRITSFSTLTREKHAHGTPIASAAVQASPPPAEVSGASPAPPQFLTAPAGAAVGTAIHDWIETWDFSPLDPDALQRYLATTQLPAVKPGQAAWSTLLEELFTTLRLIRLPGCGEMPLHRLCPESHGSEWHFHLPVAGALSVTDLARCFEQHAAPAHRQYASVLRSLTDERFQGLLQGFIDRLARCGPAWGVIDWKTNFLGPNVGDYSEESLLRCATDDHYLLQTHLYLVALRRYLRALGVEEPQIAGAWLIFLRAIAPGETRGVLHISPPAGMLDALDALFAPAALAAL